MSEYEDIDAPVYRVLYARHLGDDFDTNVADVDVKDLRVLDLCCGCGDLTMACLRKGATSVEAVDRSVLMTRFLAMTAREQFGDRFSLQIATVEDFFHCLPDGMSWDVVLCRQGINHWFSDKTLPRLAQSVSPGGTLVFDIPRFKPSRVIYPVVYDICGQGYIELRWLVDGTVRCVQATVGYPPHVTSFPWIEKEELVGKLGADFAVQVHQYSGTYLFVCLRKGTR